MPEAITTGPRRRTQQERSEETRRRLLDATIECLVELGYSGTTTIEVSKRAGLSRGAQLHHFPSKSDLVVAAIEHLADRRLEELLQELDDLPHDGHLSDHLIDLLWSTFSGPLFLAAAELGVASRTDEDLRSRLVTFERQIGKTAREVLADLFGGQDAARSRRLAEFTLDILWGLAIQSMVGRDADRFDQVVQDWKSLVREML